MDFPIPSPVDLDVALHRQLLLNFWALTSDARLHALSQDAPTDRPLDWNHINALIAARVALEELLTAVFQEVSDVFATLRRLHDEGVRLHDEEMSATGDTREAAARREEILQEMGVAWEADKQNEDKDRRKRRHSGDTA